jgi:hypothetical protein
MGRKAESNRCFISVHLHCNVIRQIASQVTESVHFGAIDGSRAHRVQAELILSIGCYRQKLRFVRHGLRSIGAQRLDQPQKYHRTVGHGAAERYMFTRVFIPFELRLFDEKRS